MTFDEWQKTEEGKDAMQRLSTQDDILALQYAFEEAYKTLIATKSEQGILTEKAQARHMWQASRAVSAAKQRLEASSQAKDELIECLQAENEQLKARVREWVSVEDRLPELRQNVLIYKEGETIGHARRINGHGDFEIVASNDYIPTRLVDWWMPLPEIPNE